MFIRKIINDNLYNQLIVKRKCQICNGYSFSDVNICWVSQSPMILNWLSLGFGLLIRRNEPFQDVTLGFRKLSWIFFTLLWHSKDQMSSWFIKGKIVRWIDWTETILNCSLKYDSPPLKVLFKVHLSKAHTLAVGIAWQPLDNTTALGRVRPPLMCCQRL